MADIIMKPRKLPGVDRRTVMLRHMGKRKIGIIVEGAHGMIGASVNLDDLIDAVAALSAEVLHG